MIELKQPFEHILLVEYVMQWLGVAYLKHRTSKIGLPHSVLKLEIIEGKHKPYHLCLGMDIDEITDISQAEDAHSQHSIDLGHNGELIEREPVLPLSLKEFRCF